MQKLNKQARELLKKALQPVPAPGTPDPRLVRLQQQDQQRMQQQNQDDQTNARYQHARQYGWVPKELGGAGPNAEQAETRRMTALEAANPQEHARQVAAKQQEQYLKAQQAASQQHPELAQAGSPMNKAFLDLVNQNGGREKLLQDPSQLANYAQQAQEQTKDQYAKYMSAQQDAMKQFPELAQKDSPMNKKFVELANQQKGGAGSLKYDPTQIDTLANSAHLHSRPDLPPPPSYEQRQARLNEMMGGTGAVESTPQRTLKKIGHFTLPERMQDPVPTGPPSLHETVFGPPQRSLWDRLANGQPKPSPGLYPPLPPNPKPGMLDKFKDLFSSNNKPKPAPSVYGPVHGTTSPMYPEKPGILDKFKNLFSSSGAQPALAKSSSLNEEQHLLSFFNHELKKHAGVVYSNEEIDIFTSSMSNFIKAAESEAAVVWTGIEDELRKQGANDDFIQGILKEAAAPQQFNIDNFELGLPSMAKSFEPQIKQKLMEHAQRQMQKNQPVNFDDFDFNQFTQNAPFGTGGMVKTYIDNQKGNWTKRLNEYSKNPKAPSMSPVAAPGAAPAAGGAAPHQIFPFMSNEMTGGIGGALIGSLLGGGMGLEGPMKWLLPALGGYAGYKYMPQLMDQWKGTPGEGTNPVNPAAARSNNKLPAPATPPPSNTMGGGATVPKIPNQVPTLMGEKPTPLNVPSDMPAPRGFGQRLNDLTNKQTDTLKKTFSTEDSLLRPGNPGQSFGDRLKDLTGKQTEFLKNMFSREHSLIPPSAAQ